jgi:predicted transcriptional regulator
MGEISEPKTASGKFMTDQQTISWIFLAIALATSTKPTDTNGISSVADGINHAVPTHKELQTSIAWLTKKGLIIKHGKNYELTDIGKLEIKSASEHTDKLMEMWKVLEKNLDSYNEN